MTIRAFQIFYNAATRAALDPAFEPLDNSANERPDWYEYWPIRNFFRANALEEGTYYGFLSPLFFQKTALSGRQVLEFASQAGDAEVITFSPHPCHGACFYNVIEQGATASPASSRSRPAFSASSTPRCGSIPIVNDSRNTVYSNYFLATPRFWSSWDRIFSRLFELAEAPGSPLREALNRPVVYAKDDGDAKPAQMKIMLMERVVSLLLASRAFKIKNYPPFSMPLARPSSVACPSWLRSMS